MPWSANTIASPPSDRGAECERAGSRTVYLAWRIGTTVQERRVLVGGKRQFFAAADSFGPSVEVDYSNFLVGGNSPRQNAVDPTPVTRSHPWASRRYEVADAMARSRTSACGEWGLRVDLSQGARGLDEGVGRRATSG